MSGLARYDGAAGHRVVVWADAGVPSHAACGVCGWSWSRGADDPWADGLVGACLAHDLAAGADLRPAQRRIAEQYLAEVGS